MKKIICLSLTLVLMLMLAACGGDQTVSAPDDSVYKADIQSYITELLDSSAQVRIFEKHSADLSGNTLTVTCSAVYEGDMGQNIATFVLTYVSSKGVIKATGKGSCYVYAYTQNGVFAKVKVTVK